MKLNRMLGSTAARHALACTIPFAAAQRLPNFRNACVDQTHSTLPHRRQSLLRRQRRSGRLSHRHAAGQHPHQQQSRIVSVPQISKSVETLGFKFSDTKILLISHGHFDHCAGSAEILKLDRRKILRDGRRCLRSRVRRQDRLRIQHAEQICSFPPTHVDRVLHDGDTVSLGGTTLTAHLTPGHTKGTTTWTLDEVEGGTHSARRHRRQPQRQCRL